MAAAKVPSLVSTLWLRQQLSSPSGHIKLLDASYAHLQSGYESYISKRIPGSQFFDLNRCVKAEPTLARNIPEPTCFTDYVRSLGVSHNSHVVVCDRGSMTSATRAWWTFRVLGHTSVSVLDGGLLKWYTDGHEMQSGDDDPTPATDYDCTEGDFEARPQNNLMKTFEDMVTAVKSKSSQILDTRAPQHFLGQSPEPSGSTVQALLGMKQPIPDSMHRGHIPGSINLVEKSVLDPNTHCLLPRDQLLEVFQRYGVDLSRPITTTCYNGHSATLLALAAYICGNEDTSVYYGSWTEWGQRASTDMVVGPTSGAAGG